MSSIVRPEFGESLPTKLGPKWRALGRLPRALIVGAAAAVLLVILALVFSLPPPACPRVGAPERFTESERIRVRGLTPHPTRMQEAGQCLGLWVG